MSQSPAPGAGLAESLAPWREAWRIRRAHPKWAVLWVAPAQQYHAFRLSRRRRDAVLAAATPEDLTAQIEHAEHPARRTPPPARPSLATERTSVHD